MRLMVFDSNSILNRAFYGIKLLTAKDGSYTNAIYGFFNIALRLIEEQQPDQVVFAFDLRAPTFRHQLYSGYKANRKGMPPELAQQLPVVKDLIAALGYPVVAKEGYEADDLLGTLAQKTVQAGGSACLATGDRDSLQLVDDQVTVLLASTRAGGAEYLSMTPQSIAEKYGVAPQQLVDTKALMGDSSDNIPGVPGIGEKTAFALIQKYHSLQTIYDQLETLDVTPSVKKKLQAGKELAFLSRQLGEINCQVPLDGDFDAIIQRKEIDNDRLYAILSRLELHSLMKRLGVVPPLGGASHAAPDAPQAPTFTVAFAGTGSCSLEACDPNTPLYLAADGCENTLTAIAVASGSQVWLIEKPIPAFLETLFGLPAPKWCENLKPLYKAALGEGWTLVSPAFDARLAGYLLSPNSTRYTVERLMGEYGIQQPVLEGHPQEPPSLALRVACLPSLCRELAAQVEKNGLDWLLHEVEIPLCQVLVSMEHAGFYINLPQLRTFGAQLEAQLAQEEATIYTLAGHPFNINSPKQLGEVLFEELALPVRRKTKSGYSTDAEVLESLRPYHEIVGRILDYRKYAKLKSTYVEGLSKAAGADSVIHTSFHQTETRTGRISSAEPNMQNIPIRTPLGSQMRQFFAARQGNVLIDADYSQIELRVLAAMAKDQNMTQAFLAGEDIHLNTAAQVFDMPPLFVTPLMRSRAKAVNFGIVYGISAFSLAKDIGVTVPEADQYIKGYLSTYDGVARYMQEQVEIAKEQGYVSTLFGRRRYLPELKSSNHNLRAFGERVAMNMPIQGTAADIIKIAMVRVFRRLRQEGLVARLILQVHDELLVEAPEAEAEAVRLILAEEMEQAARLDVPLEVSVKVGKTWQEAH